MSNWVMWGGLQFVGAVVSFMVGTWCGAVWSIESSKKQLRRKALESALKNAVSGTPARNIIEEASALEAYMSGHD